MLIRGDTFQVDSQDFWRRKTNFPGVWTNIFTWSLNLGERIAYKDAAIQHFETIYWADKDVPLKMFCQVKFVNNNN